MNMGRKREITEDVIAEYLVKKASKKKSNMFVWRKKIERDVHRGVLLVSIKAEKNKQRERMSELEKLKRRREERAIEKSQHVNLMELRARERARAEFDDRQKEEEFGFHQRKLGSQIRLREGRAKPIDILSNYLEANFDDVVEQLPLPHMVFKGLTVEEIEQLRDELKIHLEFDDRAHIQYWEALLVVCEWELAKLLGGETRVHSSVEAEVECVLQGKTYEELEALQSHIDSQMRSGCAMVVEFWEALLKRVHYYKGMTFLKQLVGSEETHPKEEEKEENTDTAMASLIEEEKEEDTDPDEWLRPRKPKYVNRVHTGYEWNRYNRTHYDHDNPPPKMVKGYHFNIFYPDLVHGNKTPVYSIENDEGGSATTCIIRFHAGPPYEDIAFRIVNKEWEYSPKKGFKCIFEKGILQLHFNFKRCGYRR